MKKMKSSRTTHTMEPQQKQPEQEPDHEELADTEFTSNSDLCQQLMTRYAASSASQHRHLVATAAAMRSIIVAESLPLTPTAYFAAAISAISDPSQTLDSEAVAALTAFMGIALSLVPPGGIGPNKAVDAVSVLVELLEKGDGGLVSTASVRSVVNCLGVLVGFCDLEDWGSLKLGLESLLKFSVDKRPKVRRCSQVAIEKAFKSFQSSNVVKEASKLVLSFFRRYMPLAVELSSSRSPTDSKDVILSKPEHLEVLHMLNVLTLIVPFLSVKVTSKFFSELQKLTTPHFSALTRHVFKIIEAVFESSGEEISILELENVLNSLASYISLGEKNPMDTFMYAATLLHKAFDKLHARDTSSSISHLPSVIGSVAGILTSEASTASQASSILKKLINNYIDQRTTFTNQPFESDLKRSIEESAIESTCVIFENAVSTYDGIPNEHTLAAISVLFLKLGEVSYSIMKRIVLQLANLIALASGDLSNKKHLQTCMGSAVIAMGPEKILELLPISLHAEDFTCSNIWLIPILKNYVVGASLGYYMERIVPLAKLFQLTSRNVKKSVIGQDLQAHAHGLWGLLPAFCRHPTDIYENIEPLVKLLIISIKKRSFMHKNIAVAIQELVNQNRIVLSSTQDAGELNTFGVKDSILEFRDVPSYSKETATRNIKALALCSKELLQALTDLFLDSPPKKRSYLKDAIGCMASVTDSSKRKKIFMLSLERCQLINDIGEFDKQDSHIHASTDEERGNSSSVENTHASTDEERGNSTSAEKDAQRYVIVELASSLVERAKEDLVNLIYDFLRHTFQATDEINHSKAYCTLNKILKEHPWFCSSRLIELMDFLLGLKSPIDIASLRSRFDTLHILMVQLVKGSLEEENTKAFLVLNEIILRLKDPEEEARKVSYDTLLMISSSLRDLSLISSNAPYHKLISMLLELWIIYTEAVRLDKIIMGYLSGSSPQIKSGAVSALSILIFKDADICLSVPDLFPSILSLLQNKALEVIKAVLGFMKVLVSCLPVKDLQNLLPDIVKEVLPWSSVSRNHFSSKVTVILEIMLRKCGSAAVKFHTPENYKGLIKTILENRRGKTNSKEAADTETDPVSADSSSKEWQKSRHRDLGSVSEKDGSFESRKRKREKKLASLTNESRISTGNGNGDDPKWSKGARPSNNEKPSKGERQGSRNNKRRESIEEPTSKIRKIEHAKGRSGNAPHKPLIASKVQKHKVGRQR